jgi:hypothetical protein
VIRGYEEIKLRNVVLFRKRAQAILKRLDMGKARARDREDLIARAFAGGQS